ncbi:MAG: DUF4313 domain-containing protein [Agathobacter sp.]
MGKRFDFYKYGNHYDMMLKICSYQEGNLAICMLTWVDGSWEPWNTLTVNLDGIREKNCAFIDTNNNGEEILAWIIRNGFAVPTGVWAQSGFCRYPEFRFKETELKEMDPEGYEDYLRYYSERRKKEGRKRTA